MRLFELYKKKVSGAELDKVAKPRNFVAKNSPTTGAGSHTSKKYSRKEKYKDKNKGE
jgi:hypothetical protein